MIKKIIYSTLMLALALVACSKEGSSGEDITSTTQNAISFSHTIASRLDASGFDSGDAIKVYSSSGWYDYSYSEALFTSSSPIVADADIATTYTAVYPASAAGGVFMVADVQSSSATYYGSDLLVAKTTDSSAQPTLSFEHMLSSVVVELEFIDATTAEALAEQPYDNLYFNAATGVTFDLEQSISMTLIDAPAERITPYSLGDDLYGVILPAQSFTEPIATIEIGGDTFTWVMDRDIEQGVQYGYTWSFKMLADGSVVQEEVLFNPDIASWNEPEITQGSLELSASKLDKTNFSAMSLVGDAPYITGGSYGNIDVAFDGSCPTIESLDSGSSQNGYHSDSSATGLTVSFDLGAECVLTEFKYWQRRWSHLYDHGNLRTWRLWGATAQASDDNGATLRDEYLTLDLSSLPDFDAMSSDGYWVLLASESDQEDPGDEVATAADYELYGLTSNGVNWVTPCGIVTGAVVGTEYTLQQVAALAGHSYTVANRTAVRYLRLELLNSWNGGSSYVICEMDIFGLTKAEYEAVVEAAAQ